MITSHIHLTMPIVGSRRGAFKAFYLEEYALLVANKRVT